MSTVMKRLSNILIKSKKIKKLQFECVEIKNNLSTQATAIEYKVNVDGVDINYVKTGSGEHAVLLLPGMMGTIWTDFKPQIDNLNKEKLTIIAWDPPGYGKSKPPNRTFPKNFHRRDATWACNFMKTLGFDKFSLIGWSDGGITSLILAATYPENVRKIIVTATHTYITPQEMALYEISKDLSTWSERVRRSLITIYGEKYLQDTLSSWIDARRFIVENNNGDICKGDLSKIKSQTLIVHGKKDIIIPIEHPHYIKANIKNSKLKIFNDGRHNAHLKYADEFNALANNFLINEEDKKL
ncbi:valacyclovir hydrolase-like [Phymastichus coffea]|uniref:valacyclovir hydrolase-like n=1 Tax=Phymastichus coffea TaxID=108790 RepID=UPI00273B113C|nr:valacyclovir hydrolase-like [Phymastichus coffea]